MLTLNNLNLRIPKKPFILKRKVEYLSEEYEELLLESLEYYKNNGTMYSVEEVFTGLDKIIENAKKKIYN